MKATSSPAPTLKHWVEYILLALFVQFLGMVPRRMARKIGAGIGDLVYRSAGRLRRVGLHNLQLALPELSVVERQETLRRTFRHLGWHLAEFCQMSQYRADFVERDLMRYEGLHHFVEAEKAGKGVLVLTGHLGAWELSSFVHSLLGRPMGMVIRRLDNPLVDRMVNRIRCMHGNRVLHKDDFARSLLHAMARGEAVGILMDTNMTPPQGVFVPFFGVEACTASGLARVARKTGAAVIPGFLIWEAAEGRYILHFGESLPVQRTADSDADALANTALFAKVTEDYIRRYPDQWLWLHRRWKTRPAGQPGLYTSGAGTHRRQPQRDTESRMASAELVTAWVSGVGSAQATGLQRVADPLHADAEAVVFASSAATLAEACASQAGLILAGERIAEGNPDARIVRVPDARLAFAIVADRLQERPAPRIAASAVISPSASLGSGAIVAAGAVIGDNVVVGKDCWIGVRVTIEAGVVLGDCVRVQAGAVLGSLGFGYARRPDGSYLLFPQQGGLVIEDDVEIGANTTIDRGALGETRIGAGTKIDNLVHIGHNCQIGRNVIIAAQTGISGSSVVEDGAILGGQVGIGEHALVGGGVILGGGAGVLSGKKLKGPGQVFWGRPARPLKQYLRDLARLSRGR
ncbi:MAG: UDP-3-O-(3-hydroxymyristoyl)glucosamine N-acyltransferase [Janthinobacterium lividum]